MKDQTKNQKENIICSIIVPVYNVKEYLDRCIASVLKQTYRYIEVILVDDGSTDGSGELCDKWAMVDTRIRVIHKENAGLGNARNTGMHYAIGDYIYFLDSDDYIATETIEECLKCAIKESADLVTFGYYSVNSNGQKKQYTPALKKYVYEHEEVINFILPELISENHKTGIKTNLWMSACGCVYSKRLIDMINWRFVSEREFISEDIYSLLLLYKHVEKMIVLPKSYYYYCENNTSLTHTYRKDRFEKINDFYDKCIKLCDKLQYGQKVKERFSYTYLANVTAAIKMIVGSKNNLQEKLKLIDEILSDAQFQTIIKNAYIRKEPIKRLILYVMMKNKQSFGLYCLVKLNTRS